MNNVVCRRAVCAEDPRPGIESWEGSGETLRFFFEQLLLFAMIAFFPPTYDTLPTMLWWVPMEKLHLLRSLSFYPLPGYKDMRQAYQKRTQSQGNGGRRGVPQDAHQQRRQDQRRPFLGLRHGGRRCGSTHVGVRGQV